ncbi:hypothetical protein EG328_001063 [Venturia inaequalis]|uniref:Uncharacterized protein n=1 Tax=Venturia inaequalis TaxID=5025 RepID=A0A8H3Z397_VENIN|nr:hypothetical protein EG328_001063 [Venturia inaequalis]
MSENTGNDAVQLTRWIAENEYLEKQIIRNINAIAPAGLSATRPLEIVTIEESAGWAIRVVRLNPLQEVLRVHSKNGWIDDDISIKHLNTALKLLHSHKNEYHEIQILANLAAADIYLHGEKFEWEFLTFKTKSGGSLAVVDMEKQHIIIAAPLERFDLRSVGIALQALHEESARVLTEAAEKIRLSKL